LDVFLGHFFLFPDTNCLVFLPGGGATPFCFLFSCIFYPFLLKAFLGKKCISDVLSEESPNLTISGLFRGIDKIADVPVWECCSLT
jgi:hypothetical protein